MMKGISLYDQNFLSTADADRLFTAIQKLPWKRHTMKMYGKEIPMPRLYQWVGATPPSMYGDTLQPINWTSETLEIRDRVRDVTGVLFDSLNVNYYRSGTDHIGWHSDDEHEGLWVFPIASVSLGAVREFQTCPYNGNGKLKRRLHKHFGTPDAPVLLGHGSLVVMPAGSQEFFVHRLLKATKKMDQGARINLTFRKLDR
jgi:alkylated DNA repair dioxygenase AlkB